MKKILFILPLSLLIILFAQSCFLVKTKYYNDLSEEAKSKIKFSLIDVDNHTYQSNYEVYLINSHLFFDLVNNSDNNYHLILSYNINCKIDSVIREFINIASAKDNLSIYLISGLDPVYTNMFIYETYKQLYNQKFYLLDHSTYGDISGWHENQTFWLRLRQFYLELLFYKPSKLMLKYDDEFTPQISIFDKKMNLVYEDTYVCTDGNCSEKFNKFSEKLNELTSSKGNQTKL